jgi:hypothetical protein
MYANYGCIHVISTIMTSACTISSPSSTTSAPDSLSYGVCFFLGLESLTPWIDRTVISSQKTPEGIGKHWDPMFAKVSASSLLARLTWDILHPSKDPSK